MSPEARRLWTAPIILGVLTLSGLVTALVSDGWGDFWSWIGLGVPVAVMTWYALPLRSSPRSTTAP